MADNVKAKRGKHTSVIKYIKEIRNELKKVIWPTWPQLVQSTMTVLFACLVIGAVIWIFDLLLGRVFTLVFGR